jgi:hypothetical protein
VERQRPGRGPPGRRKPNPFGPTPRGYHRPRRLVQALESAKPAALDFRGPPPSRPPGLPSPLFTGLPIFARLSILSRGSVFAPTQGRELPPPQGREPKAGAATAGLWPPGLEPGAKSAAGCLSGDYLLKWICRIRPTVPLARALSGGPRPVFPSAPPSRNSRGARLGLRGALAESRAEGRRAGVLRLSQRISHAHLRIPLRQLRKRVRGADNRLPTSACLPGLRERPMRKDALKLPPWPRGRKPRKSFP